MIVLPALGVAMVDDGLGTAVGQLRDQCAQGCGNDGEGDAEDGVLACVGGEFEDFVTEGIGIVQSLIALGVHFPVDVAQGRYHTVRCRFQIWRFTHGSIVMRDRRAFLPIRMGEARSGMMLRFPKTRGSKCRGSWAGSVRVGI